MKRKVLKKLCAITLCILMILGTEVSEMKFFLNFSLPVEATVDETASINFEYKDNDCGGITITKYNGNETNVVIPSKINGKSVTMIGCGAFSQKYDMKSVSIPDSVKIIENDAFIFSGLTSVNIPYGVTNIGDAFELCEDLTSVVISDSVETIGQSAFSYCKNLSDLTIGRGIREIDAQSFYGCNSVRKVRIPSDIKIKIQAGDRKPSLNDLFPNCEEVSICDGVEEIGSYFFYKCANLKIVTIPESVKTIGSCAFLDCEHLGSIVIPNGVKSIGNSAFSNCKSLANIILPDGVENIGGFAFSNCKSLTDITLPDSLEVVSEGVFSGCTGLYTIIIPYGVQNVGNKAFADCENLKTIIIPDTVKLLGNKTLGNGVFRGCTNLTEIIIPDSVEYIGQMLCLNIPNLQYVKVGEKVNYIPDSAFCGCTNLEKVELGSGITMICKQAFYRCTSLKSIYIPENVTTISPKSIGYYYDNGLRTDVVIDGFIIYGATGSCAEKYAIANNIQFVSETEMIEEIPATCTSNGKQAYYRHIPDNKYYVNENLTEEIIDIDSWGIIPATGHSYTTEIIAPTVSEQGYTIHTCSVCGHSFKDHYTDMLKPLTNCSTISKNTLTIGNSITVKCLASGGTGPYEFALFFKKPGMSGFKESKAFGLAGTMSFKPESTAEYTLRSKVRDKTGKVIYKDFTLNVINPLTNTSSLSEQTVLLGKTVTVSCSSSGGLAPVEYKVLYRLYDKKTWTRLQDYGSNTSVSFKPKAAVKYVIRVSVRDARGKVISRDLNLSVIKPLVNTSSLSASKIKKGGAVTVQCGSTGGLAPVEYAVFYKTESGKWTRLRSYGSDKTVSFTPKYALKYSVRVMARDARGKVINKDLSLTVTK